MRWTSPTVLAHSTYSVAPYAGPGRSSSSYMAAAAAGRALCGVPRYVELRARYDSLPQAVRALCLEPTGLLRGEPQRLLRDDLARLAFRISLLAVVAIGSHRVSEIGARLRKTSADLTRPLSRLVELGYLRRDVPYGESPRKSKQTLYTVADPFIRFYYRYISPEASRIETGRGEEVWGDMQASLLGFTGQTWEELCRMTVRANALGLEYDRCERWWGTTTDRRKVEIDGVARSRDGKALLLMECKWSSGVDIAREEARMKELAEVLPSYKGEEVEAVVGAKTGGALTPATVLDSLR